jgi:hypothetical protein
MRAAVVLLSALALASCHKATSINGVRGVAEKGPFVIGSNITVPIG